MVLVLGLFFFCSHFHLYRYRELETQEEAQEETGWKLVHGDVFRPPAHEMLLSVFVGNGVQVNWRKEKIWKF